MALNVADRVRDTTTTTGTGTIMLSGTPPTGYQSFSAVGNGNTTYYTINAGSQWEVGIGTYLGAGPTLSRNTVLSSSNAGALVNFAAGTKDVFCNYPASKSISNGFGVLPVANGGTGATTLSSGYVLKGNGTSAVSASVLYDNGTNVGIGTSSPSAKLTIAGNLDFDQNRTITFNGVGTSLITNPADAGIVTVNTGTTAGFVTSINLNGGGASPTNAIRFNTASTERMRIDASGNVGIGTTNPTARLHLRGAAAASGIQNRIINTDVTGFTGVVFGDDIDTRGQIWIGNSSYASYGGAGSMNYSANSGPHVWYTNYAERMRIDASGNVLVGASAQAFAEKVRVYGNYSVFDNGTYTGFIGAGGSIGTGIATDFAFRSSNAMAFLTGGATERMRIDATGNVGLTVIPPTGGYGRGLYMNDTSDGAINGLWSQAINTNDRRFSITNNAYSSGVATWKYGKSSTSATIYEQAAGQHRFFTAPAGTGGATISFTQAMTLDPSGNLLVTGNLVSTVDCRAPIFYDSNNTAYYLDPASGSRLGGQIVLDGGTTFKPNGDFYAVRNNTNTGVTYYGNSDAQYIYYDGFSFNIEGGPFLINRDCRAPIFYDRYNTNYYAYPVGISRMSGITLDSGNVLGASITFNNMNQVHPTNQDFNTVSDFGFRYFQGATNGPAISGATQYYGMTLGLGSDYAVSSYASQFYWPRTPVGGLPYPSVRYRESGSWGAWSKIYAGWADAPSGATFAATGDFRAPIFYDSNNTAYYVDPSSTGTSLNVAGSIVAAGNVTAYSDARLKENIQTISGALSKVQQLTGVTYTRNDLSDTTRRYAGLIAQDVQKVLPEAVTDSGDKLAVDYNATIGLLIQAVKELTDKVKALEAKE